MRIAQLKTATGRGGAETLLLDITEKLQARGHEVATIFAESGWLADEFARRGWPVEVIRLTNATGLFRLPRLMQRFRSLRAEIVVSHGARVNLFGAMAASAVGIPNVSIEHNVDDWRTNDSWLNRVDSLIARMNDHRIAVSSAAAHAMIAATGLPKEKVTVVPNGIDVDAVVSRRIQRTLAREELGLSPDRIAIATVARLAPQKGHQYLLEAAKSIVKHAPQAVFVIVGDGPLRSQLEAQVRDLALEPWVRFLGVSDNPIRVLSGCDVFVLPSLWEGLPIALLEAMAMGLPCVATDVGGVKEVLSNGQSGFIVNPKDETALANAIVDLCSDESLRVRIGTAAFKRVLDHHDIGALISSYERLLGTLVRE